MHGMQRAGFAATDKLNRKDFGVSWNKTLDAGGGVVGDEVEFELLVEAESATAAMAEAKK